jgi:hypothetical protein
MKLEKSFILAAALSFMIACAPKAPEKIRIDENMVTNEVGSGNYTAWFDEQDLKGQPSTMWETEGMTSFWPAGLVIDLGRKYKITEIWVYDGPKADRVQGGKFSLASGKPFEWGPEKLVDMQNSSAWVKIDWNAETRFVHLQKIATEQYNKKAKYPENCDVAINEVVLMGYPLEKEPAPVPKPERVAFNIPMDQFIGMNSYISTPDKVHEAVGCVREYRPWQWNGVTDLKTPINWGDIQKKAGKNEYSAMKIGNSDEYYQKMKDMGIECVPCIHRHVDEEHEHENIPTFGGDPLDPLSYKVAADYAYQFIARYGSKVVPDSMLRTTEAAPKKSGLNLLHYFENWNEPNRWWGEPEGHFQPYQFAAYCSASYDGHMNQMGAGFGVKNADPDVKYVHGGIAFIYPEFVKAMKLWSDYHRNGSFPSDVISVHHYSNTRDEKHPEKEAHGISPEDDQLKEKLQRLVKWRNENLPDKEIWLSELGWDTDAKTYQSAAVGHKLYPEKITMQEIQAQWLVRGYLITAAAGADRMMMFLANDLKNYTAGVYGSCGFITVKDEYKPSWYYVKTLRTALTGMVFLDEYPSGNDKVWVYRFKNLKTGQGAYVLWCPTADGTAIADYELKLTGKASTATKISLEDKRESGIQEEQTITNNSLKTNVSERPIIIKVESL